MARPAILQGGHLSSTPFRVFLASSENRSSLPPSASEESQTLSDCKNLWNRRTFRRFGALVNTFSPVFLGHTPRKFPALASHRGNLSLHRISSSSIISYFIFFFNSFLPFFHLFPCRILNSFLVCFCIFYTILQIVILYSHF